eukprot:jgi/Mesvir1/11970/Mv00289-RA.1
MTDEAISIDDIVHYPLPGYDAPGSISFVDDEHICYLFSLKGTLSRALFSFSIVTHKHALVAQAPHGVVEEASLHATEKLRRERLRERTLGVTRYEWAKGGPVPRLLVPLPDGIFVQDGLSAPLRLLAASNPLSVILEPQISPDGRLVAFVCEDEIYVLPVAGGRPVQITSGARGTDRTHGLAEYIAQEEMSRRVGFWWSPCSTRLAFTQVDASAVPPFHIVHHAAPPHAAGVAEETHHYPFAGQANTQVRLAVVSLAGIPELMFDDVHQGTAVNSQAHEGGQAELEQGREIDKKKGREEEGEREKEREKEREREMAQGRERGEGRGQGQEQGKERGKEGESLRDDEREREGGRSGDDGASWCNESIDWGVYESLSVPEPVWMDLICAPLGGGDSDGSDGGGGPEGGGQNGREAGGGGRPGGASWVTVADEELEYLAQVVWMPDGSLAAVVQNRAQTMVQLFKFDVTTGARTRLLRETHNVWVNLNECFTPLAGAPFSPWRGGFLWGSERSGFCHLYLYDASGTLLAQLTQGEWVVERVVGVNEGRGVVYVLGTFDSPLEMHLYKVPLPAPATWAMAGAGATGAAAALSSSSLGGSPGRRCEPDPNSASSGDNRSTGTSGASGSSTGGGSTSGGGSNSSNGPLTASPIATPTRLTRGSGRHAVVVHARLGCFVDTFDSIHVPPTIRLCALEDGAELCDIYRPKLQDAIKRLRLRAPELVQMPAEEAQGGVGVPLFGALYRPDPAVWGAGPYPTVVIVYGGPRVQAVTDSWLMTIDLRAQSLRSRGFLVWKLDNRGSARRGIAFEAPIKGKLGICDTRDQAVGLRWLVGQGLADPARVGICGWSYGGYLSLMALACFPQLFKVGIAGAPVTSWDGYDTHYTEQYMGFPARNTRAYELSSVLPHVAAGMRGRLLLMHGLIDENVHFQHTARLLGALNASRAVYDLLLFPEERHMPRTLKDRLCMEHRILAFLQQHLLAG